MVDRIWNPTLILLFALYALMRVDLYLKFKGYQQTVEKVLKKDRLSIFAFLNYKESQVMDLVTLAWRLYPRKTMCLERSIHTAVVFKQMNLSCQVKLGVRKVPPRQFHAWASQGNKVLTDSPGYVRRFHPLHVWKI